MATKVIKKAKADIGQELKRAIGAGKVKDDELVCASYAHDVSVIPYRKPAFVILPESRDDVVKVMKIANKHKIPVTPISGGVNLMGYTVPSKGGIALDLRRMDKILEINTDSGYALVEAGCLYDILTAALREKRFRMHVPTAPGSSSVLGNALSRPSGSMCNRQLDAVIDLEVVLPDGTVFNTGSSAFPNAGSFLRYGPYPDLAGLYTCAYGTTGIITKASIRISPMNEANRINIATFDSFGAAVKYVKDIVNNSIPESAIIWSWGNYGIFAVNTSDPNAVIPPYLKGDPRKPPKEYPYVMVTAFLSGYEETMVAHEKVLAKIANKYGGRTLTPKEVEERFPITMSGFRELYGNYHQIEATFFGLGRYMSWIFLGEPQNIIDMEKWAVEQMAQFPVRPICYYSMPFDWGRTIFFRMFVFPDPANKELCDKISATYAKMSEEAMKRYHVVPLRHKATYDWPKQMGGYYEAFKKIKKALDPNNICNRDAGIFKEDEL